MDAYNAAQDMYNDMVHVYMIHNFPLFYAFQCNL
jgi:hypothetical protein